MARPANITPSRKIWGIIEMLRTERQMDYETLALKVRVTERTVRNDKADPSKMPIDRMLRYFEVLGCEPSRIAKAAAMAVIE